MIALEAARRIRGNPGRDRPAVHRDNLIAMRPVVQVDSPATAPPDVITSSDMIDE
jgi:hypothetical protein